jgi:hypothetical protein
MENNQLLVNSFFITIFVMIVDQMFIANNLTIFQPLSDQYFDPTPMSVVKQELEEIPRDDEEEKPKKKKSKKSKKTKKQINKILEDKPIDLNNEEIYHNNEDEMYYNQYYDDTQQQRPERYVDDTYGGRGYNFQEPILNNDYNFSVEAFNS